MTEQTQMPAGGHHKPLHESSVLVVGLARDCGAGLAADVRRVAQALADARRLQWLLIESDSSDGTVAALAALKAAMADFDFESLGTLAGRMPLRTERIAFCRNRYVDRIRHSPAYAQVDYVAVADFDGLNTRLTRAGVRTCWSRDDWDVCTANQAGPYYDVWALRHPLWSPNDCSEQYHFLSKYNTDEEQNVFSAVTSRMIRIPPDDDWIDVDSAFGGWALYRRQAFIDSRYTGLTASGTPVCEHVPFHAELRRLGYRIKINPALINAAITQHSVRLTLSHRLKKRAKDALRPWVKRLTAGIGAHRKHNRSRQLG